MGLQWVRLDTAFPRNHKLLALIGGREGHRAGMVYLCSLAYAGEQGTDGFVPREALPLIHGRTVDAGRLVAAGLWHSDPGGWLINDWAEYQPSTDETKRRSDKARSAAMARWHDRPPSNPEGIAPSNANGNAKRNART